MPDIVTIHSYYPSHIFINPMIQINTKNAKDQVPIIPLKIESSLRIIFDDNLVMGNII